jgi:hypothetical protein
VPIVSVMVDKGMVKLVNCAPPGSWRASIRSNTPAIPLWRLARRWPGPAARSSQQLTPEVVALAQELRRQRLSFREISEQLAARGYFTGSGTPFATSAVQTMMQQ